jgi:hypothetical protein
MAQKIRVELLCDVCGDGSLAERTLSFGADDGDGVRREYQIELCFDHRKQFTVDMQAWVDRARPAELAVGRSAKRGTAASTRSRELGGRKPARRDHEQLEGIRQWARAHGYEVSSKGRIPTEIEEEYNRRS